MQFKEEKQHILQYTWYEVEAFRLKSKGGDTELQRLTRVSVNLIEVRAGAC